MMHISKNMYFLSNYSKILKLLFSCYYFYDCHLHHRIQFDMTWHVVKYVDPYSEFVLCSEQTHTVNTHPEQWAVISHTTGAVWGLVPCSRAPQSWYWRWRDRWTFIPPTNKSCRYRDSNLWPLGYESDSLTIVSTIINYVYVLCLINYLNIIHNLRHDIMLENVGGNDHDF